MTETLDKPLVGKPRGRKGGRPLGRRNQTTQDVAAFVGQILKRIRVGEVLKQLYLNPDGTHKELTDVSSRVLLRLMEYAYGKPQENIQMQVNVNLRDAVSQARQRVLAAQSELVEQGKLIEGVITGESGKDPDDNGSGG